MSNLDLFKTDNGYGILFPTVDYVASIHKPATALSIERQRTNQGQYYWQVDILNNNKSILRNFFGSLESCITWANDKLEITLSFPSNTNQSFSCNRRVA